MQRARAGCAKHITYVCPVCSPGHLAAGAVLGVSYLDSKCWDLQMTPQEGKREGERDGKRFPVILELPHLVARDQDGPASPWAGFACCRTSAASSSSDFRERGADHVSNLKLSFQITL